MAQKFSLKPENALNRAEDFIKIGNKTEAVNVLYYVIQNCKRFRPSTEIFEKITIKFLSLCVETRKGKTAKEGLHQFRNFQVSLPHIQSLERVVIHFLKESEERTKEAQNKAEQILADIADLEAEESTELTEEETKEKTDREVVLPWLKLLWESYRTVLELLRNNNKLEHVYKDTAERAFSFCLKYKRQTEFRRLSEMLRNHLTNITTGKTANQQHAISLADPGSLQTHLDIRISQLKTASEIELWQETLRAVEDVRTLMALSKKRPPYEILKIYFLKLSQLFWISGYHLFHAYAYLKYYKYCRLAKDDEADLERVASTVLVAALAVPIENKADGDIELDLQKRDKNERMASLLAFTTTPKPKREQILQEIISNEHPIVPELKDLYQLMEKKFHPLQFCSSLKPKLDFIAQNETFKKYHKDVEKVMYVRLLQQLSQIFDVMKISEFAKIIGPEASAGDRFHEVEMIILEAVKNKLIFVRIDYQKGVLNFQNQILDSEQIRKQLDQLSTNLQAAIHMIYPQAAKEAKAAAQQKRKERFAKILQNLEKEHQQTLDRRTKIEKQKEEMEKQMQAKIAKEREEMETKVVDQEAQETDHMVQLQQERERLRRLKEEEEELKRQKTMEKMISKQEKQQQQMMKKWKKLGQRLNYIERAKRREEKPLLLQFHEKQAKENEEYYYEQKERVLREDKERYEKEKEEKERLSKMLKDKEEFAQVVLKKRQSEYEEKEKERQERIAEKRKQMEEERRKRQQEEERQRKEKEEAMKLQREEMEYKRKEREEIDKKIQQQQEIEQRALRKFEQETGEKPPEKYRPPRARSPRRRYSPPRGGPPRRSPPRGGRRSPPSRSRSPPPRRYSPPPPRGLAPRDRSPRRRYSPPRGGPPRRSPPRGGRRSPPPRSRSPPPRRYSPPPPRGLAPRGGRSPPPPRDRSPPRRYSPPRGWKRDKSPSRGFPPSSPRAYPRKEPPRGKRSPLSPRRSPPRGGRRSPPPRSRSPPPPRGPPRRSSPPPRPTEQDEEGFTTVQRKKR